MQSARIILLCIGAAILYGLVHDQITARICIEYFTVAHPKVMDTTSPTMLALYWGVAATWWVGVLLGVPIAFVCRIGSRPPLGAAQLVAPIGILLLCMGACALVAGGLAYYLAEVGGFTLNNWDARIPRSAHSRFLADAAAHLTSYGTGFIGGVILIFWVPYRRGQLFAKGSA